MREIKVKDLWYSKNGLIYSWSPEDLFITLQFTNEKEKTEKVNPLEHHCRVWVSGRNGHYTPNGYSPINGTYQTCRCWCEANPDLYTSIQVYGKYGSVGVTTLETNEDEEYKRTYEAYWKAREEEEDDWRPGDAPWEAPGMSIHDFI